MSNTSIREKIYNFLLGDEPLPSVEIAKGLGLRPRAVHSVVSKMVASGQLKVNKTEGRVRFYESVPGFKNFPKAVGGRHYGKRESTVRNRVFNTIVRLGEANCNDIAKETGIARTRVSPAIHDLTVEGKVVVVSDVRPWVYAPCDENGQAIASKEKNIMENLKEHKGNPFALLAAQL